MNAQGEGALQVFPQLIDVIPEARLNLVSMCVWDLLNLSPHIIDLR